MRIVDATRGFSWTADERVELNSIGLFTEAASRPASEQELVQVISHADYAIVAPLPNAYVGDQTLAKLGTVKGLSLATSRFSWIDTEAAARRGITVSTLGAYSTESVAELALGLILDLARQITCSISSARLGERCFASFKGFELSGKTLGVIGMGAIGKRVAEMGRSLGMDIVAYNRTPRTCEARLVSLQYLIEHADVVCLCIAESEETRHFLDGDRLAMLKPSAILVSVSREEIIHQEAAYELLRAGRFAGFAFELNEREHTDVQEKLLTLPNVLATPHIGWFTEESLERARQQTLLNLRAMIAGAPVNIPKQPTRT
jgi:phosphoglycerate dehydrogenase-like enzyme